VGRREEGGGDGGYACGVDEDCLNSVRDREVGVIFVPSSFPKVVQMCVTAAALLESLVTSSSRTWGLDVIPSARSSWMASSPDVVERTARRNVSSGARFASRCMMAKPMPYLVRNVHV
jgi:hypothetical protein